MPVAPLFVADMTTLKARLRLSGAAQSDALAQIDEAVEWVRVALYDEERGLGLTKVNEILAVAYVENATTSADLVRTQANNLEQIYVRLRLLKVLPMLFMDASGSTHDTWNEEPLTRKGQRALEKEIEALQKEVEEAIADLLGDTDSTGKLSVVVFEPDTVQPRPGDSIRPILYS